VRVNDPAIRADGISRQPMGRAAVYKRDVYFGVKLTTRGRGLQPLVHHCFMHPEFHLSPA
jgi:hypothetical protein